MPNTMLTSNREPPNPQSAYKHKLGSQRDSLDDVAGASHTAVKHDVCLVANCSDDVFQGVQTRDSAIDLATGVVGDDDAIDAHGHGFLCVFDVVDAFEREWLTATKLFPGLD